MEQEKKVEYLTKKALREKKERAIEKIAVFIDSCFNCRNEEIFLEEKRNQDYWIVNMIKRKHVCHFL